MRAALNGRGRGNMKEEEGKTSGRGDWKLSEERHKNGYYCWILQGKNKVAEK